MEVWSPIDYPEFSKMQILVHPDEWYKKDITELQFLKSLVDDSRKILLPVDEELGSFALYRDKIK